MATQDRISAAGHSLRFTGKGRAVRRAQLLMLSFLGKLDQFLGGVTRVFDSISDALWHPIWIVCARYASKLECVLAIQIVPCLYKCIVSTVSIGAAKLVYFDPIKVF